MSREECALLHARIVSLCKARAACDLELAQALAQMESAGGHTALGYSTFGAYARDVLQIPARQARELARVGRAAPKLPEVAAAMADGRLPWTKAREIVRVASPETAAAWVARAEGLTSRELEALVASAEPGGPVPEGPVRAPEYTSRVFHHLEASDGDAIDELIEALRATIGGDDLSPGAILAAFARRCLAEMASEADEHVDLPVHEPAVLHLRVDPDGTIEGYDAETSETVAAEAACDARVVDADGAASHTIPPRIRELVLDRDQRRCAVPGCHGRFWLHLHHLTPRACGGGHQPWNLLTICACHHRLVHEGTFRLEVDDEGAVHAERADGSKRVGPPEPRRRAPHVGRRGGLAGSVGRRRDWAREAGAA